MQKDIKKQIQLLLKEIAYYSSHSLFAEAKKRCREFENLIRKSDNFKNKQKFLDAISRKINQIDNDARAFETYGASVQMTLEEQEIVKTLFSSQSEVESKSSPLEGATALLVFGQYEGAFKEFKKLINRDAFRLIAAKNILRCHIGFSSIDDAVKQYRIWLSKDIFPSEELVKIRSFLQGILTGKGIDKKLRKPKVPEDVKIEKVSKKEVFDILSIVISVNDTSQGEKDFFLDVNFQTGNMINSIISKDKKDLIDYLKPGMTLKNVQFNSTEIIFKQSCVVFGKIQISLGPKKGDYTVTLKILDL